MDSNHRRRKPTDLQSAPFSHSGTPPANLEIYHVSEPFAICRHALCPQNRHMNVASPTGTRTVSLALQGGGSHGAFTWGVLDTLLADARLQIEGISGASAGAVNAVALAHGHAKALQAGKDPRQGARDSLTHFWTQIGDMGRLGELQKSLASLLWGGLPAELAPANLFANALGGLFSPYQSNPLDINPLRNQLERDIDFAAIAHEAARPGGLQVFASATHVNTGKAVIFGGEDLTARAVTASACLPMLFQAVEIDGEHYWDGGYSGNPAVSPLIDHCGSADVVLVQINPLRRDESPTTPADIADRANELTFNASLLAQMRGIEFVNELLASGKLRGSHCRPILLHRIDGGESIKRHPASTRTSTDPALLRDLFELGQQSAKHWLERHFDALGQRATVDIRRDYLDDTRMEAPAPGGRAGPFKSWLTRLFRREHRPSKH